MRMKTILHPKYGFDSYDRVIPVNQRNPIVMTDYISVPAIETYGVWRVQDLIPPKQLANLARFVNHMDLQ